ncbi:MAG TPA: bifunctional diaminohydroxyphosphoribosylaminopyrimidine deaminase/5-amino-6-(5-phosphoribosylamino)uracil reductase RibD [Sphingorhabdus sp.]|jgi:diaminohydroxyphosphoribosylaminopyrimidine deaminase/5-amino-6-(5-phosphoribosylamino)uracil reductase|nr:bifunctional diaminohydroxyphosphoribosylaminopyrimidine deaminase/5-amino-6-(5-phosphoribosylamino)uracil reductase RibD [Sphingorhabdus sp.]
MQAAVAIAERGLGRTANSPPVGCVIVNGGIVVGRGWTQPGGRPHAEAMALAQAGAGAAGATVYVTLEPCAHRSERGPACAPTLVEAGVNRVVAAVEDPDPRTSGKGFALLRDAGIDVVTGLGGADAMPVLAGFFSRIRRGRPFLTLKIATSLDGLIAMADGSSRWITGEAARAHVHLERARADAILVGSGTVRADKPKLDVRLAGLEDRNPRRIMLGSGPAPEGWEVLRIPGDIGTLDCNNLLVEGGAMTASAFLHAGLVDRLMLYRAPVLIGTGKSCLGDIGLAALDDAHGQWRLTDKRQLGKDSLEVYQRATLSKAH